VIAPARNESGPIRDLVERIPEMGSGTEIIFVEVGSSDDTRARIKAEITRRADRNMRLVIQTGVGKWNAVQDGFAKATGEVLLIEDGDMTVDPEAAGTLRRQLATQAKHERLAAHYMRATPGAGSMPQEAVVPETQR
jgi:glycosyltransferase involved in cell wall biosynthesis